MKNIFLHRLVSFFLTLFIVVVADIFLYQKINAIYAAGANDLTFHTEGKTVIYEVTSIAPFHSIDGSLTYTRFTFSDASTHSSTFDVSLPNQPAELTLHSQWAVRETVYSTDTMSFSSPNDVIKHDFKYLHETLTPADMSQYQASAKRAYLNTPSCDSIVMKILLLIFSIFSLNKLSSCFDKFTFDRTKIDT